MLDILVTFSVSRKISAQTEEEYIEDRDIWIKKLEDLGFTVEVEEEA